MLVVSSSSFDLRTRGGFYWYNGRVQSAFRVQFPTGHGRDIVAVNSLAFAGHGIEHFVDPGLDLISSPFSKWWFGNIPAAQYHAVRDLQDPNRQLFPEPAAAPQVAP